MGVLFFQPLILTTMSQTSFFILSLMSLLCGLMFTMFVVRSYHDAKITLSSCTPIQLEGMLKNIAHEGLIAFIYFLACILFLLIGVL